MRKPTLLTILLLILAALPLLSERNAEAAPPVNLQITLSTTAVTFPDQDPDLFPVSQQSGAPVQVILSTKNLTATAPYSCSVIARGDLMSGTSTIPIANVTWTAVTVAADPGESFFNGTLSSAAPVKVAQGYGNDSRKTPLQGNLTFFIQNLWSYETGTYSQTVDFTISAP
ncbi:hypothetical protein [Geomobilimonas luticola]|nr:hypothetical protein [Geomobilimonas luticola]